MTKFFDDFYGKDVNLIKLDEKYLSDMWEYSSDYRMYEHFEFGPQKSILETKEYLCSLVKKSNAIDAYWWFVQIGKTKKVVGSFGVHDVNFHKKSCEISYALSPNFWGKGVFMDVLKLALQRLINEYHFHRITAVTSSENFRSIEALKKIGFKIEGEYRDFYLNEDKTRFNATPLALIKSEYREL